MERNKRMRATRKSMITNRAIALQVATYRNIMKESTHQIGYSDSSKIAAWLKKKQDVP